MRIAVVGGGFYGVMAALESMAHKAVDEVVLYEKSLDLFNGAAKFNQARLHLGYHYPRSPETIRQSIEGAEFYTRRFPNVRKNINNNVYVVRADGLVSPESYVKIMRSYGLNFSEVNLSQLPFEYKSGGIDYVALRVEEEWIDCSILELQLKDELCRAGVKVLLDSEVIGIDCNQAIIETPKESCSYDLVINCTYENPFLGFEHIPADLKYELCVMHLVSAPSLKDHAITIMDGGFVSVYPWISGVHSFSSVLHTPAFKVDSLDKLHQSFKSWTVADMARSTRKIREHVEQYFDFEYVNIGSFHAKKIKLMRDIGDSREVRTFQKGKCMAVLPGKLDAVAIFLEELKERLRL